MCKRYYTKYVLSICTQITTPCCVCVLPIGRSILIVSFPWLSSTDLCELPFSVVLFSTPVLGLPGGRSFHSPLNHKMEQIAVTQCICPSQAPCYQLFTRAERRRVEVSALPFFARAAGLRVEISALPLFIF